MAGARHSDLDVGDLVGLNLVALDPWPGLGIQISMLATGRGSTSGGCSIHGRDSTGGGGG
jgi:hypothetical protein